MKILFDNSGDEASHHAKRIIKSLESHADVYPHLAVPKGVAHHSAQYPLMCDDCGETYWSRDQYGSHIGCRGERKEIGF